MWYLQLRREVIVGYLWENLRERDHGRPKHRYEYNIKMVFQEVGRDGLNLADWRALVNMVMNFRVSKMWETS